MEKLRDWPWDIQALDGSSAPATALCPWRWQGFQISPETFCNYNYP